MVMKEGTPMSCSVFVCNLSAVSLHVLCCCACARRVDALGRVCWPVTVSSPCADVIVKTYVGDGGIGNQCKGSC
jgi:hypothetical protein